MTTSGQCDYRRSSSDVMARLGTSDERSGHEDAHSPSRAINTTGVHFMSDHEMCMVYAGGVYRATRTMSVLVTRPFVGGAQPGHNIAR